MEIIQIGPLTLQMRKWNLENSCSLSSNTHVDNGFYLLRIASTIGCCLWNGMVSLSRTFFSSLKYFIWLWMNASRKYFYNHLWNINYTGNRVKPDSSHAGVHETTDYIMFLPQPISNKPPTHHLTISNITQWTFQNKTKQNYYFDRVSDTSLYSICLLIHFIQCSDHVKLKIITHEKYQLSLFLFFCWFQVILHVLKYRI